MTDSNEQLWAEHLLLLALLVGKLNNSLTLTCATKPAQCAEVLVNKNQFGNFVIVEPIVILGVEKPKDGPVALSTTGYTGNIKHALKNILQLRHATTPELPPTERTALCSFLCRQKRIRKLTTLKPILLKLLQGLRGLITSKSMQNSAEILQRF